MGRKRGYRPHRVCILKGTTDTEGTSSSTQFGLGKGQPMVCDSLEAVPHPAHEMPTNQACSHSTLMGVAWASVIASTP